jgi:hypothetical protein
LHGLHAPKCYPRKGQYLVPIIDEFLNELKGASWFSTLDLCPGFHQIPMNPADTHKTAFQTHSGYFEFRVMSFGLTGAPHSFQRAMNSILTPILRKFALVFFDDILVYSKSYQEHLSHLDQVFSILQQEQWKVKMFKCSFAKKGKYLICVMLLLRLGYPPVLVKCKLLFNGPNHKMLNN